MFIHSGKPVLFGPFAGKSNFKSSVVCDKDQIALIGIGLIQIVIYIYIILGEYISIPVLYK